ncbi:MAG: hypothetical protein IT353_08780 [Gemmatimonadaceae bacterium]|nr:hypothetical protein [Gemmatimonadaceae bacterium]
MLLRSPRSLPSFAFGVIALVLSTACGGGDGGTSPTPSPTPGGFSLTASTTPSDIIQSGSGTAAVTVTRTGSFSGAVSITAEGAPAGVTVTPTSTTVASGTSSATLSINVSLNVVAGTYPITIRGQATGLSDQTTTLSLRVVTRPPSVTLSRATSTALSQNAGGVPLTFVVILSRIEFLGGVTLTATGLPTGVTASFTPVGDGVNSSTVTLTAAASTAPGTYNFQVRAEGAGITPATLPVSVTIIGPASVVVGVSRPIVLMPQNGSSSLSVTLERTNFTGGITLAAVGLPTGVTATFANNPATANGTTLSLQSAASTNPGTYIITITAAAAGITGSSTTLTLTISPLSTSGNITFKFCGAAETLPIWFGFVTGRNWSRILPASANTFSFDFVNPGTTGSVAWVTRNGPDDYRVTVHSAGPEDMAVIAASLCPSPNNRSVSGTVAGLASTDFPQVVFGPRSPTPTPTASAPGFTITGLPDGALDLLASRLTVSGNALVVDKLILNRALNPANGGSVGTLDFNGGTAIAPETKTLTVQGAAADEQVVGTATLRTAGGALLSLGSSVFAVGTSTAAYRHVPLAAMLAGDHHLVQASATRTDGTSSISRSVSQPTSAGANLSMVLGQVPGEPHVFALSNANDRTRFNTLIPVQTDYGRYYIAGWFQQSGAVRREMVVNVTHAASTETTGTFGVNISVSAPDFTNAPGFDPLWEPRSALTTTYFISVAGWSATGGLAAPLQDGVITRSYTRTAPVPQ